MIVKPGGVPTGCGLSARLWPLPLRAEGAMKLNEILVALNADDSGDAGQTARLGFLEWLGGQPADSDASEQARKAVIQMHGQVANGPAVREFRRLLCVAAQPLPRPQRKGGRTARLH